MIGAVPANARRPLAVAKRLGSSPISARTRAARIGPESGRRAQDRGEGMGVEPAAELCLQRVDGCAASPAMMPSSPAARSTECRLDLRSAAAAPALQVA